MGIVDIKAILIGI